MKSNHNDTKTRRKKQKEEGADSIRELKQSYPKHPLLVVPSCRRVVVVKTLSPLATLASLAVNSLMPCYGFPKSRRLLKAAEFDRVFRRRRSQADGMLLVYACENSLPHARLGLVVSRKVGNSVARNRWKRCLREAFRLAQHELPAGLDLIVLPRAGAEASLPRMRQSPCQLVGRLARQMDSSIAPSAPPPGEVAPS